MNNNELKNLATHLHDNFCHENHMDRCNWGYEQNDPDKWNRNAHASWLKKAKSLSWLIDNSSILVSNKDLISIIDLIGTVFNNF